MFFVSLFMYHMCVCIGTVKDHGKNGKKTRHAFVKIAKITAFYVAANLLKLMVSNPRKI